MASASFGPIRGGQDEPAGGGGFDSRRDDVLEQRIFDHSLSIGFDH